jgi:dTDP-4-dehydrorhamnose reductase
VVGRVSLTAAGETSWHGFTEAILRESLDRLRKLGKQAGWCDSALASLIPIPASEYKTVARRPGYSVLSNEKVVRVFGIRLPDWRDQLRMALEDFRFEA